MIDTLSSSTVPVCADVTSQTHDPAGMAALANVVVLVPLTVVVVLSDVNTLVGDPLLRVDANLIFHDTDGVDPCTTSPTLVMVMATGVRNSVIFSVAVGSSMVTDLLSENAASAVVVAASVMP